MPNSARWIVNARVDGVMIGLPFLIGAVALGLLRLTAISEPIWVYLLGFVAFDVAHVWATAYMTYLDPQRLARRRGLYLWPIPLSFMVAFLMHWYSPVAFWTGLAYFAIYHFAKQQYGFIAIYKALAGERDRFDYRLDKLTLWTGALGPVLLWHATPAGQFDWFESGERFLIRLDPAWHAPIWCAMLVVAAVWLLRQGQQRWLRRETSRGKQLFMVASWASWMLGVRLSDHLLVSAAFLNFFHGLPFLVLVWRRLQARVASAQQPLSPVLRFVTGAGRVWAFYGLLLSLAVIEEIFWDGLIWRTYLPTVVPVSYPVLSSAVLSLCVALLSTPQIVHYFLDGVVWKLNHHNDDLFVMFGLPPPKGQR